MLSRIEFLKLFFWAQVPLLFSAFISTTVGQPVGAFAGMALLGVLTVIYEQIGGAKKERFMAFAIFTFLLLAMSVGGWADQGLR